MGGQGLRHVNASFTPLCSFILKGLACVKGCGRRNARTHCACGLYPQELMLAREKPGATKDALWTETMRGEGLPAEEGGEGEYRHSGPVAALREQLVNPEP